MNSLNRLFNKFKSFFHLSRENTRNISSKGNIRARDIVTGVQINHIINVYRSDTGEWNEKIYRAALDSYLKWLRSYTEKIALRGIQREDRQAIELPLQEIYVPLAAEILIEDHDELKRSLATRGQTNFDNKKSKIPPSTKRIGIHQLLDQGGHLVIVGRPGCGKTTVLQHIAWILSEVLCSGNIELATNHLGLKGELPLPIYIPLSLYAEHRRRFSNHTDPRQRQLATFINYYLLERQSGLTLPDDFFAKLLIEGRHIILLLDGLDEIRSMDERALVSQAIHDLTYSRKHIYCIVTSRTQAYRGKALISSDFRTVNILPLKMEQAFNLIQHVYKAIYPKKEEEDERKRQSNDLIEDIKQLELRQASRFRGNINERLVTSPLLVRMLLIVHFNLRYLPEQRTELYMQMVDTLLTAAYNPDEAVAQYLAQLGGDWRSQRDMFQYLAFNMHSQGKEAGHTIAENDMSDLIWTYLNKHRHKSTKLARKMVDNFISINRQRSSLLEEQSGRYRFSHLSFQEFLTARYLAEVKRSVEYIAQFIETKNRVIDPWWRETFLLTFGYLNITTPDTATNLIYRLAHLGEINPKNSSLALASTELAASAFLEWNGSKSTSLALAKRLADLLTDPYLKEETIFLNTSKRVLSGQVLAKLGDPRFGVGSLSSSSRVNICKDLIFCEVSAGEFVMGSDPNKDSQSLTQESPQHKNFTIQEPFLISRYPITNSQFQKFIDADDGYRNNNNWTKAGLSWRGRRSHPQKYTGTFSLPNHPVVGVTWYECIAYCQWLKQEFNSIKEVIIWQSGSPKTIKFKKLNVRLPNEIEWEKAARGTDARLYTWGNSFNSLMCSSKESNLTSTSAVGIFPNGESPYGVMDMCGNVWEWCQNIWGWNYKNDYDNIFNDYASINKRVVRGGGFDNNKRLLRVTCRFGNVPSFELDDLGFRIIAELSQ